MDHTIIESVHIKYAYPYLSCHIKTYKINNTYQYAFYIYKNLESKIYKTSITMKYTLNLF